VGTAEGGPLRAHRGSSCGSQTVDHCQPGRPAVEPMWNGQKQDDHSAYQRPHVSAEPQPLPTQRASSGHATPAVWMGAAIRGGCATDVIRLPTLPPSPVLQHNHASRRDVRSSRDGCESFVRAVRRSRSGRSRPGRRQVVCTCHDLKGVRGDLGVHPTLLNHLRPRPPQIEGIARAAWCRGAPAASQPDEGAATERLLCAPPEFASRALHSSASAGSSGDASTKNPAPRAPGASTRRGLEAPNHRLRCDLRNRVL